MAPDRTRSAAAALFAVALFAVSIDAVPQALYKYRGENGEWIYADRPPDDGRTAEVRNLTPAAGKTGFDVTYDINGRMVRLIAVNGFHAPVEFKLSFQAIRGLEFPDPDVPLTWVAPARSRTTLLSLALLENAAAPYVEYSYEFIAGDPASEHRPPVPYRAPFAIANDYTITQAYPDAVTHVTRDSRHAVDIAMPIGTNVFAARGGVVFDVSSDNFKSGTDPVRDMANANIVRILHDDGTYALYAHLNWNSIRVRPGDTVTRGQYIADSGNTGFSSGPHLHFAVMRNTGLSTTSLPVSFEGLDSGAITPASGRVLTAY